jgi:phosphoinositide-3-kinase regulatory subunit 4
MVGALHDYFHSILERLNSYSDGHEAGVNNLLEHLYLDSNREYQHDFGPRVHEGPVRRRNTVRQTFTPRDGTARRPEAMLIAQLASHTDAVTAFAVSPDHLFFVSSSDDKTVKIWDTARLERNVTSKPRFSYAQHQAKIKAVCMLEGVHCFASAADDGSLHVVRVHVGQGSALPRYTKIHTIREHRTSRSGEYITCMIHYDSGAPLSPLSHGPTHVAQFQNRHLILSTRQHTRQYAFWIYVLCGFYSLWNTRTTADPLRPCAPIEDTHG